MNEAHTGFVCNNISNDSVLSFQDMPFKTATSSEKPPVQSAFQMPTRARALPYLKASPLLKRHILYEKSHSENVSL